MLLPTVGPITLALKPLPEGSGEFYALKPYIMVMPACRDEPATIFGDVNTRFERSKLALRGLTARAKEWFEELSAKLSTQYGSDVEVIKDGEVAVTINTSTLKIYNAQKKRLRDFDLEEISGSTIVPHLLVTGVFEGRACIKMTHLLLLEPGDGCIFD